MQCWRDGGAATGNYYSVRWFLVELANGQEGFVHSSFVTNQVAVPNCDTLARVKAADWALTQVGQTYAPTAYGQGALGGLDWTWVGYSSFETRMDREWSGDCAKLPYIAYKRLGLNYPLDDANKQWQWFNNNGTARYTRLPRYGDPVFTSASGYGHTGLYVGGQSMVGTRGMDKAFQTVEIYSLDAYPAYLGWGRFTAS